MRHTRDTQAGEALGFTLRFYSHAIGSTLVSPDDGGQFAEPIRALRQRPGGTA